MKGKWAWTDGSAWDYTDWSSVGPQPNNRPGENCFMRWDDLQLHDHFCDCAFSFVCKMEPKKS